MAKKTKEIQCSSCGGHGLVSEYTGNGEDFLGAAECDSCNGSGRVFLYKSGAIVKYPGGPFCGSYPKQEVRQIWGLA